MESARSEHDPLYVVYVLILVLGPRKGEVLGLTWGDIDLDAGELSIGRQLQRVSRQLLHRETKTATPDATLPLPDVCATALRLRKVEKLMRGIWLSRRGRVEAPDVKITGQGLGACQPKTHAP